MAQRRQFTYDKGEEVEVKVRDDNTAVMVEPLPPTLIKPVVERTEPAFNPSALNAAAELLLAVLPEDTQELARECAEQAPEYGGLWAVVAGYVQRARETGNMFAPTLLPEWADGILPSGDRPCTNCGEIMEPKVTGQKYCCNACACERIETLGGHSAECALI